MNTTSGFQTCQTRWLTDSASEGLVDLSPQLSVWVSNKDEGRKGGREGGKVKSRFTTGVISRSWGKQTDYTPQTTGLGSYTLAWLLPENLTTPVWTPLPVVYDDHVLYSTATQAWWSHWPFSYIINAYYSLITESYTHHSALLHVPCINGKGWF